ncbi:HesA/MoeB/ThiF family protein [Pseudoalteromonas ruthenica]|uniref:HesA/MoeB/ThiF family protein n=2 Tax=Pseudoalteromonas TaxID=53246 RepID=UPI00110A0F01|nr:HesA/MoeB/ThiF family protein [Pseudoalteromonas ruthenica]TMO48275.1 molybdopterin-synthase adenylyltransferase MoeB [Pseudoalteromonas ruthenica]TMO52079.1 molybdopterin-synthase adenylyltransferase MoeB [Pseudoalteromonas ruthenica]
MNSDALSNKERIRYARQLLLDDVGEAGQLRLKQATVLVVGCGGLGSPALLYLAASGVGKVRFMDDDEVELSNLQRQILFKLNHLGQAKTKAANKVLASLNSDITLEPLCQRASAHTLSTALSGCDLVLDCSDNFETRYLLNKTCKEAQVPLLSGAAVGHQGHLALFDFGDSTSPCYACLFPPHSDNPTANCATLGVISPLLGIVGAQQAMLAINYLLKGNGAAVLHCVDGETLRHRAIQLQKDPQCPCCGQ